MFSVRIEVLPFSFATGKEQQKLRVDDLCFYHTLTQPHGHRVRSHSTLSGNGVPFALIPHSSLMSHVPLQTSPQPCRYYSKPLVNQPPKNRASMNFFLSSS